MGHTKQLPTGITAALHEAVARTGITPALRVAVDRLPRILAMSPAEFDVYAAPIYQAMP